MIQFRWRRRNINEVNLWEVDGNLKFLNDFEKELKACKFSTSTPTCDLTTVKKQMGFLCKYNDSFLNYLTSKDGRFTMDRWLDIDSENFLELEDPLNWIRTVGGTSGKENPARQIDMYKMFMRLIDFLAEKMDEPSKAGINLELTLKRDYQVKRLKRMAEKITNSKVVTLVQQLFYLDSYLTSEILLFKLIIYFQT